MGYRILYTAGPGDVIAAHSAWRRNEHLAEVVSVTFSSQFEQFCEDVGADAYIVASHAPKKIVRDGSFVIEHRPKPFMGSSGALYHISEIWYGLGLLVTALRFRANVAVIESGTTHYFVASLFRLFGMRVIAILHNTLWPAGYPPTRIRSRAILALDSLFFRHAATAVVGVSPECIRQVQAVTGGHAPPLYEIRCQFSRESFANISPPPPFDQRPVMIMSVGRAVRSKGIFDILEIARKVEERAPGQVRWELCGSGPDLEELRDRHRAMGLESVVNIRGWTSPAVLTKLHARSFASIVATRSEFREGFAMTAVESILAGRPVITSPVVPALEVLRPACVAARTDDVDSYVEGVLRLITDRAYYEDLCRACPNLVEQFYDRELGKTEVLKRVFRSFRLRSEPARNKVTAGR